MERILIRLPNWLGDLLMARPLLHALRRVRPAAVLAGVAPGPLLELIAAERVVDETHAWPRDRAGREAVVRALRAAPADAALVLPPSFSSALFAWRAGARVRVGYRHEMRGPLLTRALRRPARGDRHLSGEYLDLGAALIPALAQAGPVTAAPPLALPPRAADRADDALARAGAAGARIAIVGPGALYGPAKRWGTHRFAAVARALAARGLRVLVCGAEAERDECEAVAAAAGAGVTSLAGATDLPTQAALCARAAVALCNDSGLAHLAAAVGTPTVTIFGSTSSAWTAPLGARVRVLQRAPVCAPCFQRTCRIGYRCLEAVEVGPVVRACLEAAA